MVKRLWILIPILVFFQAANAANITNYGKLDCGDDTPAYKKKNVNILKLPPEAVRDLKRLSFLEYLTDPELLDINKGLCEVTKEADEGNSIAQFTIASLYIKKEYPFKTEMFKWHTDAAAKGDKYSAYLIGDAYYHGYVVSKDYDKAAHWLGLAATQGIADAQFTLGVMYTKGQGVAHSDSMAAYYVQLAADQGHMYALWLLSTMYVLGKGVPQDFVLAYVYANLAASKGHKDADTTRGELTKVLSPQMIEDAQRLSREWTEKHKHLSSTDPLQRNCLYCQ